MAPVAPTRAEMLVLVFVDVVPLVDRAFEALFDVG